MKIANFPALALAMAVFIQLLLPMASTVDNNGETMLPLLTLLVIAEFGFVIALAGAYAGAMQQLKFGFTPVGAAITLVCAALAIGLLLQGIDLWPL
jgi:hypothetical protein